jgi:hypothetical protein
LWTCAWAEEEKEPKSSQDKRLTQTNKEEGEPPELNKIEVLEIKFAMIDKPMKLP